MADTLPPELKVPEITRLVSRANQIRSHKPAIAYWCTLLSLFVVLVLSSWLTLLFRR